MRRFLRLAPVLLLACATHRPLGEASRAVRPGAADASAPPPSLEDPPAPVRETCLEGHDVLEAEVERSVPDKQEMKATLDLQLASYQKLKAEPRSPDEKKKCASATAAVRVEIAMSFWLEVFGGPGRRGTGDPHTMEMTLDLLRGLFDTFPSSEIADFHSPYLPASSVTPFRLRYAEADLLYFLRRWDECGRAFDAALAEDPGGKEAAEVAYASRLCKEQAARDKDGG